MTGIKIIESIGWFVAGYVFRGTFSSLNYNERVKTQLKIKELEHARRNKF